MAIPLKVAVYKGSDLIGEQRFDRDIIKIGRLASAHLKLDDPKVSRIHAVIEVSSDGQELSIIDMGSSDGTFVNGERVSKEKLRDGDEIRVGECRLVLTLEDASSVDSQQVVASAAAAPPMAPAMSYPPDEATAQAQAAQWAGGLSPEQMPTGQYAAMQPQMGWTGGVAGQPVQPQWDPTTAAAMAMSGYGNGGAQPGYDPAYAQQLAMASQMQAAQMVAAQQAAMQAQIPTMQVPQQVWVDPNTGMAVAVDPNAVPQNGFHGPWGSVPNNLASDGVPETERSLEIKLVWGDTVVETINEYNKPVITMGDEPKVVGWGPLKHIERCDIDAPSKGLPDGRFPLAVSNNPQACSYAISLHESFSGYVEKADGTTYALADLVQSGHGIEKGDAGVFNYGIKAEETLYVTHGLLTMQIRYVRKQRFLPGPLFERLNYTWLNILILAFFFHVLAIATFLATPHVDSTLVEELFKNPNRFAQFRLTPEKKKEQENFLAKLKAGEMGAKAKGNEGKAGKKDHKEKTQGRMAVKGNPNDKEIAKSMLNKLFDQGNRSASYLFGSGGLGGELKGALGGVTGAQIGDAAGLGGLGTRGSGPGGGGLSMNSVGLGALGTQGRGGGGDGSYGSGVGNLGKKADRDINISAGNPVIMGSLDKELIRKVIEQHKAQIRYCYEKELVRTPGLFGKVNMEWVITAEGTVRDAKAKESTMNNGEVDRCMADKIRTWIFPKPKGGGIVIVRYPFVFKTAG